jgi:hypothetical protein
MFEPACFLFEHKGRGGFAFGCFTEHIWKATNIDFSWDGSDQMTEVCGDGSAELQPDGSLQGEICYRHGDEDPVIAQKWTSSIAW